MDSVNKIGRIHAITVTSLICLLAGVVVSVFSEPPHDTWSWISLALVSVGLVVAVDRVADLRQECNKLVQERDQLKKERDEEKGWYQDTRQALEVLVEELVGLIGLVWNDPRMRKKDSVAQQFRGELESALLRSVEKSDNRDILGRELCRKLCHRFPTTWGVREGLTPAGAAAVEFFEQTLSRIRGGQNSDEALRQQFLQTADELRQMRAHR